MSEWWRYAFSLLQSRFSASSLPASNTPSPRDNFSQGASVAMAVPSDLSKEDWILVGDIRAKAAALIHRKSQKDESAILDLLKKEFVICPSLLQCTAIRDTHGYNLLQNAVIQNLVQVVEHLISVGAEVNGPVCGRPLHLAAKLGHSEVLRRLLGHGADPLLPSAVCYPYEHSDRGSMTYSTKTQTWSLRCERDTETPETRHFFDVPLHYAILSDSIECVQVLCEYGTELDTSYTPLHLACKEGSFNSMCHFTKLQPKWVNMPDPQGNTPLQLAIRWGKPFIKHLIFNGASILVKTSNNETLLHLLFNEIRDYKSLSESVAYLLQCGLNVNVNTLDHHGQTALHLLIQMLCFHHSTLFSEMIDNRENEELFYEEVIKSLKLMLKAKANANICNRNGDRGLHILVRRAITDVPFRIFHELFELLLLSGANVNLANSSDTTVIQMFVNYGCRRLFGRFEMDFNHIDEVNDFIRCLDLLWQHCCRFASPRHQGYSCLLHMVLSHLSKLQLIVNHPSNIENRIHLVTTMLQAVMSVVEALLVRGCRPNVCGADSSDLHILFYTIMNISPAIPLTLCCSSLLLLLHHGADPTIGGIHRSVTPLHHQRGNNNWSVFPLIHILNLLASPDITTYRSEELLHLALMFYSAMGRQEGNRCIRHFLDVDRRNNTSPVEQTQIELEQLLDTLTRSPLSLKHSAARTLYLGFERKLLLVDQLPLPSPLKEFLKNLQYVKIPCNSS